MTGTSVRPSTTSEATGIVVSAAAPGPAFDGVPAYVTLYDAHSSIAPAQALRIAGTRVVGSTAIASTARA